MFTPQGFPSGNFPSLLRTKKTTFLGSYSFSFVTGLTWSESWISYCWGNITAKIKFQTSQENSSTIPASWMISGRSNHFHRLRHGIWSQQAQSSCRYLTCFPRSNKNKIRDYLNKEIGLTLPESRRAISDFAQHARALTIRLHTPQCLISEKMVRLI